MSPPDKIHYFENKTNELPILFAKPLEGFAIVVTIIYASGFLAILNFLHTFGIREVCGEFWKGRYIYIGFMLASPAIIIGCTLAPIYYVGRKLAQAELGYISKNWVVRFLLLAPIIFIVANAEVTTYFYILLLQPSIFHAFKIILSLFVLPIVVILLIVMFEIWRRKDMHKTWVRVVRIGIRFFIVFICVVGDYYLIQALNDIVVDLLKYRFFGHRMFYTSVCIGGCCSVAGNLHHSQNTNY